MVRRLIAIGLLLGAFAAGVSVYVLTRGDGSALSRSRDRIERDAGWDTATHAGETLASIGEDLLRAGTACDRGPRCDDLLSASGWSQVAAVRILRCTRPAVFQTRADARTLVDDLGS